MASDQPETVGAKLGAPQGTPQTGSYRDCEMTSETSSTVAVAASPVIIREYNPSDRAALREICRQAARHQPDPLFLQDDELVVMLFLDYYLDYEPDCCFVAESSGRVVGYIVGCKDTAVYEKVLRRRIAPRVLLRIARKIITLQYRRRDSYRALWWRLAMRPGALTFDEVRPSMIKYPAHSHFNVEPGYRGQGVGYKLGVALEGYLRKCGVTGIRATLVEKAGSDSISRYLCARRGYRLLATRNHPVLQRLTGQEYVLKLLVCDFEDEARNAAANKRTGSIPRFP
jgi:GNAT superfamily N-acetyltransferase